MAVHFLHVAGDQHMRIALLPLAVLALSAAAPAHADKAWDQIKDATKSQISTQAETRLGLANPAPAGAKAYIIEPKDGAEVKSPVKVVFGLSGMGIAPAGTQFENSGHHHLLVDDPPVEYARPLPTSDQVIHFGKGQTETTIELKPGKHTLQLLLGDWKHQPHNPAVQSEKITITVK
jgi:hypothetical protein